MAVSPGVGARLRLLSGLALRGDLSRVIELGRERRAGTEVSASVSLPL